MSKYTTEVRYICETAVGLTESQGYKKVNEIIEQARSSIFDFEYPIFDEAYKGVLERKILKHYYTREIGAESIGLWKLWLDTRMNEIMPYYNQLYKSALLEFNPLYDIDVSRKHSGSSSGEINENNTTTNSGNYSQNFSGNENINSSGTDWDKFSDTPQGGVSNIDNDTYLTNARKKTNNNETSNNTTNTTTNTTNNTETGTKGSKANNTEEYLETVQGKQGSISSSKLLLEYRETFLNIDKMVIDSLSDLFFNLW